MISLFLVPVLSAVEGSGAWRYPGFAVLTFDHGIQLRFLMKTSFLQEKDRSYRKLCLKR
jgi:hypothetical protein